MIKLKDIIIESNISDIILNTQVNIGDSFDDDDVFNHCYSLHSKKDDFDDGDLTDRIYNSALYVVNEIDINEIDFSVYSIDIDKVKKYINLYFKNKSYPLIVLNKYNNEYDVIDGMHRAIALKKAGLNKIYALVGKD